LIQNRGIDLTTANPLRRWSERSLLRTKNMEDC
jgi:hypothetical protein